MRDLINTAEMAEKKYFITINQTKGFVNFYEMIMKFDLKKCKMRLDEYKKYFIFRGICVDYDTCVNCRNNIPYVDWGVYKYNGMYVCKRKKCEGKKIHKNMRRP